jgi:hypothetical protein
LLLSCLRSPMTSNHIPFVLYLQTSGRSEATYQVYEPWSPLFMLKRENHSATFQNMCYLSRHRWSRRTFTVVMSSKPSELSIPEII